ncbi:hypothetical protein ebA2571 [Aromatoleum aromaticum EbN1]|uniref:Uncharacterized protein n=1 Tax=Aromatoleum aromaticum (strain DSM 19018 / LMG 30748 / EbN1) TaxID=76114 RepID=Q5P541_AROAE|nr:hypothetical protein ebA2571 [Aromatoleum aromaticum EbN1]
MSLVLCIVCAADCLISIFLLRCGHVIVRATASAGKTPGSIRHSGNDIISTKEVRST